MISMMKKKSSMAWLLQYSFVLFFFFLLSILPFRVHSDTGVMSSLGGVLLFTLISSKKIPMMEEIDRIKRLGMGLWSILETSHNNSRRIICSYLLK